MNLNIQSFKRIVIKIGTSSLTNSSGELDLPQIQKLVEQMVWLHQIGKEVVLVSSGAIANGRIALGWEIKELTIPEKQAAASVGQVLLTQTYNELLKIYGLKSAQILVTKEDLLFKNRLTNASNTMEVLLKNKIIPIVNENDTVAVDEIKFGDNDTLSAMVAKLVNADLLILLSDIDGLYNSDPRINSDARLIPEVQEITPKLMAVAGEKGTVWGSGGMRTKLLAAKIATNFGIPMIITNSRKKNILNRIFQGESVGTLFREVSGI
ncbi:MAG: glutamate 5-kinase [Halanaerobiales bacterium]|nr:glutamate 5-kinase [Halanaerobiales bacterium]